MNLEWTPNTGRFVNCWTKLIISVIILLFTVDNPSHKKISFWYHMLIDLQDLAHFDFQGVTRFLFADLL